MPGDLAVLQKQVFPVAGYASAQSLSDDRIPSAAVRQAVAPISGWDVDVCRVCETA